MDPQITSVVVALIGAAASVAGAWIMAGAKGSGASSHASPKKAVANQPWYRPWYGAVCTTAAGSVVAQGISPFERFSQLSFGLVIVGFVIFVIGLGMRRLYWQLNPPQSN